MRESDYSVYRLSPKEALKFLAVCGGTLFCLGLLFYRSVPAALICFLTAFLFRKRYSSMMAEKRRRRLLEGFRDTLYSLSSSFAAGYQMPRAISRAAEEMENSYGRDSDIARELNRIRSGYEQSHADMSALLSDFGRRSSIEEIEQFAQVYSTCRSCGADIEQVCLKSAGLLLDKISFQAEVRTMISQKKADIILLTVMPVAVLLFLNLASYDYISVLYETTAGRMVMTCCLLGMGTALLWGLRITDVKM